MRTLVAASLAIAAFASARAARVSARGLRPAELTATPYAPSPTSAPILALGYRELGADLLFVRMVGYFAAYDSAPADTAALAEAIVALDPRFRRAYELGATAMTDARRPPDRALQLRALALLERGMREFPTYWRFPNLAGQIYLVELQTEDPAQRRRWDEKGALLLESASRKPGAPADAALHAAILQSRIGERQRAIDSLREILLLTTDQRARKAILDKLAELTDDSSEELAAEIFEQRKRFEHEWRANRPAVPASMYVLIGARLRAGFDLEDLATGGRDLIGSEGFERLEPVVDAPGTAPSIAPFPTPTP